MSHRVKRPNRSDDGSVVPAKRRKRPTVEEEEAASLAASSWQPRPFNDLKSIYNRTATEAPAELFRKDLISAMKLPDSEPLAADEYWVIVDQWKQEWEKGVQVPVNPDQLPEPCVTVNQCAGIKPFRELKMPKNKYIRITKDENFRVDDHILSPAPAKAEAACSYDLDECDVAWLRLLNGERALSGLNPVNEDQLERVIERLEINCWDKIQSILRNEEGLGIEYDENVICDVCRSPDSEEGNEMVFCDSCNICVHQACYGITRIPDGQWLCGTCSLAQKPECVLCPNKGGAMKATRSGQQWAHVSCALWIPEVSIGCVEKMEPITKISSIPQSRWALICVLCRERVGACIQCSVKTCKTAYHVTCAFKHGLEMRAIIEDENADDGVKLRSYCEKHSKTSKKEKSICSGSDDDDSKKKKRKDMTSEEKNQARVARLQEIEAEFEKHVSVKDVTMQVDVDSEALQYIYNYWKLKRRAGHNKPLLPPKSEDVEMLSHKQEQADLIKMKTFVQLRQDLERVRNLCYMVSRREKLSRTFFRMREQTFHKQLAVLVSGLNTLPTSVVQAVIDANHGPSIYDRLYSNTDCKYTTKEFNVLLSRIAGIKSPSYDSSLEEKKHELNGLLSSSRENPYKKMYFNGSSKRRSASLRGSCTSSTSSSDEKPKDIKDRLHQSSTDDEKSRVKKKVNNESKQTISRKIAERRKKRFSIQERKKISSSSSSSTSSSEDEAPTKKDKAQLSKSSRLHQIVNELGVSGTDSDELMPISTSKSAESQKMKALTIYSDTDSSNMSVKNDDKSCDSQQNLLRTKAAMKEFCPKPNMNKSKPVTKTKAKSKNDKDKKDYDASDLIVPQRQAAKKASENLKSTSSISRTKEQTSTSSNEVIEVSKPAALEDKLKTKAKPKTSKEVNKVSPQKKDSKLPSDVFDIDKEFDKEENPEILSYVPQRQAAKKAAEHIKSGLGKPLPSDTNIVDHEKSKREAEPTIKAKKETDKIKKEPAKITENKRKSSSHSSASSSSNSSSTDSSTSSTSDSDDEPVPTKQLSRSESLFSSSAEQTKRSNNTTSQDWPFLDKASKSTPSKPPSTSSSSDSSDDSSSSCPSPKPKPSINPTQSKTDSSTKVSRPSQNRSRSPIKTIRKSSTEKVHSTSSKREEPSRVQINRGKPRSSNSSDKFRDVYVGSRDHSVSESMEDRRYRDRKGKSDEVAEPIKKEISKSNNLFSTTSKEDKKLSEKEDIQASNLEREILERKAGRDTLNNRSKSSLDRFFDKKYDKSADKQKSHEKTPNRVSGNSDKNLTQLEIQSKSPKKSRLSPEKTLKLSENLLKSPEKHSTKSICDKAKSPEKSYKIVEKASQSPIKENKEPSRNMHENKNITTFKKSPLKNKTVEEVFSENIGYMSENKLVSVTKCNKNISDEVILIEENENREVEKKNETNIEVNLAITPVVDITNEIDEKFCSSKQNRSIFSPPQIHKDADLLDFDILDDGFGISKDEEIVKGPLTFSFGNAGIFKEDSKEDSARETLNLVEKLRMEYSKKSTSCDVDDLASIASSTKNDTDRLEMEQIVPNDVSEIMHKEDKICNKPLPSLEMRIAENVVDAPAKLENEKGQEYKYPPCEIDISVDKGLCNNQQSHVRLDHSTSAQADERWVPPSENYQPVMESYDQQTQSELAQPFIQPYPTNQQHSHQVLPTQVDIRLQEDLHKNQSPTVHDRRTSQTPYLEQSSMDCMPSPSTYGDIHPQAKWADSQVMPTRRSSSSSAASTSSSCSRRNEMDEEVMKRPDVMMLNHSSLEMPLAGVLHLPYPTNPLDNYPAFSEPSQFVSPVSLFPPPPNINTQIPFPSPGAAIFPTTFGAAFPTSHSVIPPLPKPVDESLRFSAACTAAFTSSQHNMALTAAMVNLPSINTKDALIENVDALQSASVAPTPPLQPIQQSTVMESTFSSSQSKEEAIPPSPLSTVNHIEPSPTPSVKSNSSVGKKSPSKPTRSSARFISQQQNKSPIKSPGKSPKSDGTSKSVSSSRGRGSDKRGSGKAVGRGQASHRGRGRGRGRGRSNQSQHSDFDFGGGNTIHNKLIGTVYDLDFDDDISNDNMGDLKSMRERRKSADVHDTRRSREPSMSPKFASPASHKNRTYTADLRELRPPSPIKENVKTVASPMSLVNESQSFPDIVQPVLPGPVDMRTYNSNFDSQTYTEANLLGAFASGGTAGSQVHEDIDEDFEKELHSALIGKKENELPVLESASNIKVSLSDSRNQLKVKIKGPIANYKSTASTIPSTTVDNSAVSIIPASSAVNNVITNAASAANSGPSSLRRMRKKELLHQYCNQNNSTNVTVVPGVTATPTIPPINRTIITIPKAVASMTSIPTRDDYSNYRIGSEDIAETKPRKESKARPGALSRELRQLDLPIDDDSLPERRRSIGSTGSNVSGGISTVYDSTITINKRRGRPSGSGSKQQQIATPKLKIKISGNSIIGSAKLDDKKDKIKPPKKRLKTMAPPSVEDVKRENMKFRKKVMADFGEKRKKKDKSGRRKRRKEELQIISNETENPTKLIIRFGRKTDSESENKRTCGVNETSVVSKQRCSLTVDAAKESDDNRPNKVTPIKLKISRQAGLSYVMKTDELNKIATEQEERVTKAPSPPPDPPPPPLALTPPESVHTPAPLPLNKDCEVR